MASNADDTPRVRFERLFTEHHAAVRAYVRRRAEATVVDDVVAETFMTAWRRIDAVPADAGPWLFGVARRVLSTHRRGERRRNALRERLRATAAPAAAPDAVLEREDRALLRALARLPERDREALLLVAWEDLSVTQAAAAMGVGEVTMRVRLHRARKRLSTELDEQGRAPASARRAQGSE